MNLRSQLRSIALAGAPLFLLSCTQVEAEPARDDAPLIAISEDGTRVQLYDFGGSDGAQPVLLFHQARSSALGEYPYIAERLTQAGYRVFGADLRSGGDLFGEPNQTAVEGVEVEYCDVYPDLIASAERISEIAGARPIVIGSSYSAALAMKLAVEHPELVSGFASFSPAGGAGLEVCAPSELLDGLQIPGMGIRPRSEIEGPPSVAVQAEEWRARGVPMEVVEVQSHGASVLDPSRAGEGAEAFWPTFLDFLAQTSQAER